MKRSRKQRKFDSAQRVNSQLPRNTLSRADIHHLDEIAAAVLDCDGLDDPQVGVRYHLIADLLHANVTRLDLDEDTMQIVDFARRIAGELVNAELRRGWFGSDSCWDKWDHSQSPWYARKIDGKNRRNDEYSLRAVPDQKIAMLDIALTVLESDPTYRAGALALRHHQIKHALLPDKFSLRHIE